MRVGWRQMSSSPLAMLFLTLPAVFLPLDVIFAGPGIAAYATPAQAARIFLYSAALAFVASVLVCLLAAGLRAGPRVTLALCLMLSTFAVLHSFLLWSQYFSYSLHYQWLRHWAVAVLSVAAGPVLVHVARDRHIASFRSVLRASTALVTVAVVICSVLVAPLSHEAHGAAPGASSDGERPPIILITVDALSALYLPMYGYALPTAPRLAEFARGATLFTRNYANANLTTPSVNSIVLGMRPWTHRAIHLLGRPLARTRAGSLPALLKAAGYFTAAVVTNPWAGPDNLGLSEYFSVVSRGNVCFAADPVVGLPPDLQLAVRSSTVGNAVRSFVTWASDRMDICAGHHFDPELAFAEARSILARAPVRQPLFLWVHLFAPHDPYVTPPPFVGTFAPGPEARTRASTTPPYGWEAHEYLDFPGLWKARYLEGIRYVDHHIGAFLDELKKSGLYGRALIVISADHGESFSHFYGAHAGPALHEELVRVPLLIKEPRQTEHREITQLSEQADLLPTILELAGIAPSPGLEGVSLRPALRGEPRQHPAVFSMNFEQSTRLGRLDTGTVAMVEGRWKYVHYFGLIRYPFMPVLEDGLYDLAADPWEMRNRIPLEPQLAARMRKEIESKLAQYGRRVE